MTDSDRLLMFLIRGEARRAGDKSYIERTDVTSGDDKVAGGLIVVQAPEKDEASWHAKHSVAKR